MWLSTIVPSTRLGVAEFLVFAAILILIYGASRIAPRGPFSGGPRGPFAH